jgi:hypothetical protein
MTLSHNNSFESNLEREWGSAFAAAGRWALQRLYGSLFSFLLLHVQIGKVPNYNFH